MHFRRFACFLLGAWLAGILVVAMVATQNFRTVDRILLDAPPGATQELKTIGHQMARMLLRWEAGEQNRRMFETWETAQLVMAMAVFFVLLFGSTEGKYSLSLALLLLMVVILQRFLLTPVMVSLGRMIDFVPEGARSPERIRFQVLHMGYGGLEAFKCVIGILLAGKLLVRSRRKSGQTAGDVDVVDKTYHRHVNR
jgi:NAD-dependent DNA ligase